MAKAKRVTEPLDTMAAAFVGIMASVMVIAALATTFGSGSIGGFGQASVCANLPNMPFFSSDYSGGLGPDGKPSGPHWPHLSPYHAQRGASIDITGAFRACAVHPTLDQKLLYTLTALPMFVFWALLLWLLLRVLRTARNRGPFTTEVAYALHGLGWFVLVGVVLATAVQAFALDALLLTFFRGPGLDFWNVILMPLRALFPVPALASAALLTFARIMQSGVTMDQELKATV